MILCVGTTPAAQRVMMFPRLELDSVNRATTTLDGVAGKSVNVAKVLRALDQEVLATGFVGRDHRGDEVLDRLHALGAQCDFIRVTRTRQCTTVIDRENHTITELVEESPAATPADYDALLSLLQKNISTAKAVVMSGTLAPGGPPNFYHTCTLLAHSVRALPIVDAQGPPLTLALKAKPALVKPNRTELAATVGRQFESDDELMSAMRELHEMGAGHVVVTAGKKPTFAFDGKTFWKIVTPGIAALNPIGSGDSVTAAIVWRLLKGDDLGNACGWGSAAGAANALTAMAGELSTADLERVHGDVEVQQVS